MSKKENMALPTREFIAIIGFDENTAIRYDEVNGHEETEPMSFFEREFGWLDQSGLSLESALLVDFDDTWDQYLRYLTAWAIDHSSDEYKGMSPAGYDEWLSSQYGHQNFT